jgi:hypothetical protein
MGVAFHDPLAIRTLVRNSVRSESPGFLDYQAPKARVSNVTLADPGGSFRRTTPSHGQYVTCSQQTPACLCSIKPPAPGFA